MITYPLTIPPGPPGPNRVRLGRMAAVASTESPITFQQQIQDWAARRWELEMTWPAMTATQAAPFQAFLDALSGKVGTFLAGDLLGVTPQGTAKGSPICNGQSNGSGVTQLVTAGWIPNQSGVLLPRDYLQVQPPPNIVGIASISATNGLVTMTIISSFTALEGFHNPFSWIFAGAAFNISGTGIADGGPFIVASVSIATSIGIGGHITATFTIIFSDPSATNGSVSNIGTITQISPPQRLHRVMTQTPISTDGGGNATIDIFPPVRELLPSGTAIVLTNTAGTFRLAQNRTVDEMDSKKTITISFKAVEAI